MTKTNTNEPRELIIETNIHFPKDECDKMVDVLLNDDLVVKACKLQRSELHGFAAFYTTMVRCGFLTHVAKDGSIALDGHQSVRSYLTNPSVRETIIDLIPYMNEDAFILWRTKDGRITRWYRKGNSMYAKDVEEVVWSEPYLI